MSRKSSRLSGPSYRLRGPLHCLRCTSWRTATKEAGLDGAVRRFCGRPATRWSLSTCQRPISPATPGAAACGLGRAPVSSVAWKRIERLRAELGARKLAIPLDGLDLMEMFERPPGP